MPEKNELAFILSIEKELTTKYLHFLDSPLQAQ
jgi:hypothetical protein